MSNEYTHWCWVVNREFLTALRGWRWFGRRGRTCGGDRVAERQGGARAERIDI